MTAIPTSAPPPPAQAARSAEQAARPALLLACGNPLRQDDGIGLRVAEAAEHLFSPSRLRVVAAQQFTPEMAADVAMTDLVIFVDACVADDPGAIRVRPVAVSGESTQTHGLGPSGLLAMAASLCGHAPERAFALTVGADHFGFGADISGPLRQAVPRACRLLGNLLTAFAGNRS